MDLKAQIETALSQAQAQGMLDAFRLGLSSTGCRLSEGARLVELGQLQIHSPGPVIIDPPAPKAKGVRALIPETAKGGKQRLKPGQCQTCAQDSDKINSRGNCNKCQQKAYQAAYEAKKKAAKKV